MKLKKIHSSEKEKYLSNWHDHFLWIPRKVEMTHDIKDADGFHTSYIESEYSWLWLETVKRKKQNASLELFIYWKKL